MHLLLVTPDEFIDGALRKIALQKSVLCGLCKGHGGEEKAFKSCKKCKGKGVDIRVRQFLPGYAEKYERVCDKCLGRGEVIDPKDHCTGCNGKTTVRTRQTLEVQIEKGMQEGHRFVFKGEGDQAPDLEPGDIIIVLKLKRENEPIQEPINLIPSSPIEKKKSNFFCCF